MKLPFPAHLPRNVWVLAASQALAMSGVPMMVLVSGLLATQIAPSEKLATLPAATLILGVATSTIPAAMAAKRFGRRFAGMIGFSFGFLSCVFGYVSAAYASFVFLLASSVAMGVAVAFGQQFRFAALESVESPSDYGTAVSVFMTGGLLAAYLGPELGARGEDLVESPHGFAGSFILAGVVIVMAAIVFQLYRPVAVSSGMEGSRGRTLKEIVRSRAFVVAAGAAALSYGVMSLVMTATPITMYELCGFSLQDTKWVIQSHVMAMYAPSLASGWLMKRFGPGKLILAGTIAYAVVIVVGFLGRELMHFWYALVALGIGWNFLFASGTALLPHSYRPEERYKAQAANDFLVFGCQATAALSSGVLLFTVGWNALLGFCVPALALGFGAALWQRSQ